jgi:hypothetical protein
MVATATRYADVASALATMIQGVAGLRVYSFIPDNFRPPGAVVAMPRVDYQDQMSGFCRATWTFPVSLIVARTNEKDSQSELSRLLGDIVAALDAHPPKDIFSVEPLDALPGSVSVNGQELPAYNLRVQVRA